MMTARERVKAALRHEKPDRIPRYEIFLPGYIDKWRKSGGLGEDADIYSHYPKVDIGRILALQAGPFSSRVWREETDGDSYLVRDSWGRLQRFSRNGTFFEVMETAIDRKEDLDGFVFEDPWCEEGMRWYDAEQQRLRDRFALVSGVMGLFMGSYYLRGELELMMDMKEDESFTRTLAERVAGFIREVGAKNLECTDTWDTAIWVYDELGNNKSSVISPETFERIYLEPYKKMISYWKSLGAQNIILHCDGNCLPLMDLLIEAGFTGIQGVNPSAGMTVPEVKAKYGNKLALIGGMCNIHVLTKGTAKEIEKEAASIVEAAKDGGVVIGTHSIDWDIPIENYDLYYSILERLDEQW